MKTAAPKRQIRIVGMINRYETKEASGSKFEMISLKTPKKKNVSSSRKQKTIDFSNCFTTNRAMTARARETPR